MLQEAPYRLFLAGLLPAIAIGVILGFTFPQEVSRAASVSATSVAGSPIMVVEDTTPPERVSVTETSLKPVTRDPENPGKERCDKLRRQWERAAVKTWEPDATEEELAKADELYWKWVEC